MRGLTWFRQLMGVRAFRRVILVTTFWDGEFSPDAVDREAQLRDEIWEDLLRLGAITLRNDSSRESAREVLRRLLSTQTNDDGGTYPDIQEQMVDQHKSLGQTTVGQDMEKYLAEQCRRLEQELASLRNSSVGPSRN